MVDIIFRSVKGSRLTKEEVDSNFANLKAAVEALESNPAQPKQIDSIEVVGDQMTITLSDGVTTFTVTIPTFSLNPRGAYQPATNYAFGDTLFSNGSMYLVLQAHTSPSTFNPSLSNMSGPIYGLMLRTPTAYDISMFVPAQPGNAIATGEPMFAHYVRRPFTLPAALDGSGARLGTATTGTLSFNIRKNGVNIGSINFAAAATLATFTFTTAISFDIGDILDIIRPTNVDATARNLSVTLVATRNDE